MRTVYLDIDTQYDFMLPAGALYVPGAEALIPRIAALNRYALAHGIRVASTMDAHAENDREFQVWPPHCVAGTWGQQKAPQTLLENRFVVPNRPTDLSSIQGAQQIIVEKDQVDLFQTPNIAELLGRLNADRYVVYGVVTEICVRLALEGLLRTGKSITVVRDAIQSLDPAEGDRSIATFQARGISVVSVSDLTAAA